MMGRAATVSRWTPLSRTVAALVVVLLAALAFGPWFMSANAMDKASILFIYVILAVTWNALAGYGGLVSIGQQVFIGLGGYFVLRLSEAGLDPFVALFAAAALAGLAALVVSGFMLKLKDGEFAIGMWVLAALAHLAVNLDPVVHGETGASLLALNAYAAQPRRVITYFAALGAMIAVLGFMFALLRSRFGASLQAIRDNEGAAISVGVRVVFAKRLIFVVAAVGAALGGALWLASTVTFQPRTYFGVQWTAYMIFMCLVGGLGTFEGPILGAVIFFVMETFLGAAGVWYLVALGAACVVFTLFAPKGLWGECEARTKVSLIPVGRWVEWRAFAPKAP